jgi:hypothetical protein
MSINHNVVFVDKTKENDKFFCPICKFILNTADDFRLIKTYDCCHICFLEYAECRKEEWSSGWRPDKEKVREYIKYRK